MKSRRGRKTSAPKLLGVGFDNEDGQKRITKAEEILIVGGSKDTHERMQEEAIRMNEEVARRGKPLSAMSERELSDVVQRAEEQVGR